MNIVFFKTNFTPKITKNNIFQSNPVKFKGLKEDCFEKTTQPPVVNDSCQTQELSALFEKDEDIKELKTWLAGLPKKSEDARRLEEDIKEAQKERGDFYAKLNPNIAFLHDDTLSWSEKRGILKEHPEILQLVEINDKTVENPNYSIILKDNPYFIKDKISIGNFVDLSFAPNKENLDELLKETALSIGEICKQYNFNAKEFSRYVNTFSIKPIQLRNLQTGEKEYITSIYDTTSDEFQKAMARKNQIAQKFPKKSKYINQNFVSAQYLAKLKLGSEEELIQQVQQKNLKGVIKEVETENGKKETAFINIKDSLNLSKLQYLRNQNPEILTINELCAKAKISVEDFEDALIEGEIENIPIYIIENDKTKLLFNTKNPKNAKFIGAKQIEYEIAALQAKKLRNQELSFKMKLVWSLCPNTLNAVSAQTAKMPGIIRIFEKLQEIKDFEKRPLSEKTEEEKPTLSEEEKIRLKTYFKKIWANTGTKEFSQAHKRASEAMKEFKKGGIDAISDLEIRQYFRTNLDTTSPNQ